jgi:hypothetical protein
MDTIKTQLRETLGAAAHHTCGTAAMLPRDAGGVVDQDLKECGREYLPIDTVRQPDLDGICGCRARGGYCWEDGVLSYAPLNQDDEAVPSIPLDCR